MQRTRAWRRSQVERIIANRHKTISRWWACGLRGEAANGHEPHRLSKWNLTCDCGMCNHKRHRKNAISVSNGRQFLPFESEDVEGIPADLLQHLQPPHKIDNC